MAGLDSTGAFNADTVRTALRAAMTMGQPSDVSKQVTFRWPTQRTTAGPIDPSGIPYNLSQVPLTDITHPDTIVPAAVRHVPGIVNDNPVGEFDPAYAVLTLVDLDYQQVVGATQVLIGGIVYDINFVAPPIGLFDFTAYEIHCRASSMGDHKVTA